MENIRNQVGTRIRELRKARGWSREELAERAGLHNTYVSQMERGKRNVSPENLQRLASAFSLSLNEFLELPRQRKRERSTLESQILMLPREHNTSSLRFVHAALLVFTDWSKRDTLPK